MEWIRANAVYALLELGIECLKLRHQSFFHLFIKRVFNVHFGVLILVDQDRL